MTYNLTIAAPRSQRWAELAESAWARNDPSPDYSERLHLASTGSVAARALAVLQRGGEWRTEAISKEIGGVSAYTALRLLLADGDATRRSVVSLTGSGHFHYLWSAR